MAHRSIGQERLGFAVSSGSMSSLDDLSRLIDWDKIAGILGQVHSSAKGEPAWPPLAMFKALLLSVWYDLSDVRLAEALDDRASFRTFCGFSRTEATPERTAFVRFRKVLIAHNLDRVSRQIKPGGPPLDPCQRDQLDRVEAGGANMDRLGHGMGDDVLGHCLQQPQDLDKLALAPVPHARLEQMAQVLEHLRQVPAL